MRGRDSAWAALVVMGAAWVFLGCQTAPRVSVPSAVDKTGPTLKYDHEVRSDWDAAAFQAAYDARGRPVFMVLVNRELADANPALRSPQIRMEGSRTSDTESEGGKTSKRSKRQAEITFDEPVEGEVLVATLMIERLLGDGLRDLGVRLVDADARRGDTKPAEAAVILAARGVLRDDLLAISLRAADLRDSTILGHSTDMVDLSQLGIDDSDHLLRSALRRLLQKVLTQSTRAWEQSAAASE